MPHRPLSQFVTPPQIRIPYFKNLTQPACIRSHEWMWIENITLSFSFSTSFDMLSRCCTNPPTIFWNSVIPEMTCRHDDYQGNVCSPINTLNKFEWGAYCKCNKFSNAHSFHTIDMNQRCGQVARSHRSYCLLGREKKNVLRWRRKLAIVAHCLTLSGKVFQILGAATGKALMIIIIIIVYRLLSMLHTGWTCIRRNWFWMPVDARNDK